MKLLLTIPCAVTGYGNFNLRDVPHSRQLIVTNGPNSYTVYGSEIITITEIYEDRTTPEIAVILGINQSAI